MQSVVAKGKDINEAILLGLDLLGATKKEVNIEIIRPDTKVFFGIHTKEAIVKLTKFESNSQRVQRNVASKEQLDLDERIDQLDATMNEKRTENIDLLIKERELLAGKAWVKDGHLFIEASPTKLPRISVNKGIKLLKNNQLVKEKTTVLSENDNFELMVENVEKATKWKVSMDEQKLHVFLHVKPGYKLIRKIVDVEPDHHIKVTVEEKKEIHNTLNFEDVIGHLKTLKVKHGFKHAEIRKAMEARKPETFEIATGIKSKPGKDGWIEANTDLISQIRLKETKDGLIDYREINTIPAVEKGQIIAFVHQAIPSECGYTVTNEPLPVKRTTAFRLKEGRGIKVVDHKIIVTEPGRPYIVKQGRLVKVSIIPKLTIKKDVDLAYGNVNFGGDVEILSGVKKGVTVETEGDIFVRETVNMASLSALGSIAANGNIIGSEISAGKKSTLVAELDYLLGILYQDTETMIAIIKQLIRTPGFKDSDLPVSGLQPLIRILLEQKFKSFPALARKFVNAVRRGESDLDHDDWKEIAASLTQLLSVTNDVMSLERFVQLSNKMKDLHETSKNSAGLDSHITISNALNSLLYCSGHVMITGDVCRNTKIYAGGSLKAIGTIYGGEVYARLGVEINEVGAESGTPTVVAVPKGQIISINKAMEGTSIKIGSVTHLFKETKYLIRAQLINENRIVFN